MAVLADGDGEADIHVAAHGDQGVGIEAAVSPHGELSAGASVAHPSYRLAQEVSSDPRRVGPALAQPTHQHVAGDGPSRPCLGQQPVMAPLAGVVVTLRALLGQPKGLADG